MMGRRKFDSPCNKRVLTSSSTPSKRNKPIKSTQIYIGVLDVRTFERYREQQSRGKIKMLNAATTVVVDKNV
jgi:hypothetical protein